MWVGERRVGVDIGGTGVRAAVVGSDGTLERLGRKHLEPAVLWALQHAIGASVDEPEVYWVGPADGLAILGATAALDRP